MNCFVIMPFAVEFDDVYAAIKTTVEGVAPDSRGRCFRLDEARPAGRITERLLAELRSATLCIADLTETKPNVMWELGFAMALGKPAIIITQSVPSLPFDIKDMQSIEYDRNRLNATLTAPLRQSLLDTLGSPKSKGVVLQSSSEAEVGRLLSEVAQLKAMVGDAVNLLKSNDKTDHNLEKELQTLSGHWFNTESGSHAYSRVIRGELVSPYCYGDNNYLTGVYFGWRRAGDYWFARYKWLDSDLAGFSFLRMESVDRLSGAWWSSEQEGHGSEIPPRNEGVQANWLRQAGTKTPKWAEDFFSEVEKDGLASVLARAR